MGQESAPFRIDGCQWRRLRPIALIALAALALGAATGRAVWSASAAAKAGAAAQERESAKARVRIVALVTQRGGATGTPAVEIVKALAVGEHHTAYLASGQAGAPDLCDIGSLSTPPSGQPHLLWTINVHLLELSGDRATLRVAWSRSVAGGRGLERQEDDTRTVSLSPGDYHVIDVARSDQPGAACANLVVRLTTDPADRPLTIQPLLTYDLWLVHRDSSGREAVRHQQVLGPAETDLAFYLAPLRWRPSGHVIDAVSDREPTIRVAVAGSVRATRLVDGALNVAVAVRRLVGWGEGVVGGDGRAAFRCVAGETLVLALPQPSGQAESVDPQGLRGERGGAGVTAVPHGVLVDFQRFFAASKFALYLRVRG
jgi:hypothetical protein